MEGCKFKVGSNISILKFKNIFVKGSVPNCPEKGFMITKVKNTDLNREETFDTLYKKDLEKSNHKEFRI